MILIFKSFDEDFDAVNQHIQALMNQNAIKPVISKSYHLEDVVMAHEQVFKNDGTLGRLAFEIF